MDVGGRFEYFSFSAWKLGKIPILTRIFQLGWNHHLGMSYWKMIPEMFVSFRFHSPSVPSPTLLAAWLTVLTGQKLENGTLIRPSRCVKFVQNMSAVQLFFWESLSELVGPPFLLLEFVPWHHLDLRNCNFPMVPLLSSASSGICMLHITFLPTFFGLSQESEKNSGHLSVATRWDVDPSQVPVDPLSMETLARRPQQADEVHKGGGGEDGFSRVQLASFLGSNFFNSPEINGDNGKSMEKKNHFYIDSFF